MIKINDLIIQYDQKICLNKQTILFPDDHLIGIFGESGCGKTSLLNRLALLETCDIEFDHLKINSLSKEEIDLFKLNNISYLQQESEFIKGLNCKEILELEASLVGKRVLEEEIIDTFNYVGLENISNKKPSELSGGQQQLLSIAQAIIKGAKYILCDEITSSLDQKATQDVFQVLKKLSKEHTIIMVTHEEELKEQFDLLYIFENKNLVYQSIDSIEAQSNLTYQSFIGQKLLRKAYRKSEITFKTFFYILLVIAISLCSVGYKYSTQITNHIKYIKKMANTSNYTINYTYDSDQFIYSEDSPVIQDNVINNISKSSIIDSIEPVNYLLITPSYIDQDKNDMINENIGIISYNNKDIDICNIMMQSMEDENGNQIEYISNYENAYIYGADTDVYDHYCTGKINKDGEIYLTSQLAYSLGISSVNDQTKLQINALVPVENITLDTPSAHYDNYGNVTYYSDTTVTNTYTQITIEVEIRGILDKYFPNRYSTNCFYLDNDLIQIYIDQYQKENYLPNMYSITSQADSSKVKELIKQVDPNLDILDMGSYYDQAFSSKTKVESLLQIYVFIGVIVIIALGILYSFMQYRSDKKFYHIMRSKGLSSKYLNQTIIIQMITDIIILSICSVITTLGLYKITYNLGYLHELSNATNEEIKVFMIAIGLSFVLVIIMYSISLIGMVKKHD